jgi:hypothetical protein
MAESTILIEDLDLQLTTISERIINKLGEDSHWQVFRNQNPQISVPDVHNECTIIQQVCLNWWLEP